jgi:hypothetical protein
MFSISINSLYEISFSGIFAYPVKMEFSIVLTKISNPERHRIFITALNTDEVTAARLTFLSKKEKGN